MSKNYVHIHVIILIVNKIVVVRPSLENKKKVIISCWSNVVTIWMTGLELYFNNRANGYDGTCKMKRIYTHSKFFLSISFITIPHDEVFNNNDSDVLGKIEKNIENMICEKNAIK